VDRQRLAGDVLFIVQLYFTVGLYLYVAASWRNKMMMNELRQTIDGR